MNKLIAFLILFLNISCFAQKGIIKGFVFDEETGEPIFSAHVFLGNTTIGVTSDIDGKFNLQNLPAGQFELVISMVGYQLEIITIEIINNELIQKNIQLQKDSYILNNIDIEGIEDKKWQKYYKKFESLFLGNSPNADLCEITNPWVLDFTYNRRSKVFQAFASEPIQISNNSLGYRLYFHLISFSIKGNYIGYYGIPRFELISPIGSANMKGWIHNRHKTYMGSRKHFFKALVDNSLNEEGFFVQEILGSKISSATVGHYTPEEVFDYADFDRDSIYIQHRGRKLWAIWVDKELEIHCEESLMEKTIYKDSDSNTTRMILNDTIICESQGYIYNPDSYTVYGFWAKEGVADMLPFEYNLETQSGF